MTSRTLERAILALAGLLSPTLVAQAPLSMPAHTSAVHPMRAAAGPRTELNSASKAELMKLPGITADYAEKIISGRPYRSKADVISHRILPPEFYASLKDKMMVMPPKTKKK